MSLSFPTSPTLGDVYTLGNRSWTWTGAVWSASADSDTESFWTSADVIAAVDERVKRPSLAPMVRANRVSRDGGLLRVGMVGMSIASFNVSLPWLGSKIQAEYGRAEYRRGMAGVLGGSYTSTFQGWEKQPYGGRAYTRLRGKAASASNLTLEVFGDTVNLWFSVEANSEACNIEIDDVVVGTTPAAGTQQYAVKQTFDGLGDGYHKIEIIKPAGAGFVYLEEFDAIDTSKPGVIVHNWTLGGSSLANSTLLRTPVGSQVAGVAISGDAGIDGYFANDDIDLYVVMHDVNDAGRGSGEYATNFLPMFTRMVEATRQRAVPLVLVSSMAGHYAVEVLNPNHYGVFNTIRALYRSTAATESHVTHIDWHGATILDDLDVYQQTYYPNVVGFDTETGEYAGDFIHPDVNAYAALQIEFAKAFGLGTADGSTDAILNKKMAAARTQAIPAFVAPVTRDVFRLAGADGAWTFNEATDTITTTSPHGLAVGDKVVFRGGGISGFAGWTGNPMWVLAVPTATTLTVSYTEGGAQFTVAGSSDRVIEGAVLQVESKQFQGPAETGLFANWYAPASQDSGFTDVAVWFDRDAHSADGGLLMSDVRLSIQSSPDGADAYGNYKTYTSNTNVPLRSGIHLQFDAYILVRYSGTLVVAASTDNDFKDATGDAFATLVNGNKGVTFPVTEVGDRPVTAVVRVRASSGSASFFTLGGSTKRVYDLAVSPSPIWPGL